MTTALDPFDLDAAVLRRSAQELNAFMEALAVRLEGTLPGRVEVRRRRDGFLSRTSHVAALTFHGERGHYHLTFARGTLAATRAKLVRGVSISSSPMGLPEWLAEVRAEVRDLAEQAGVAGDALGGFL